MISLQFSPAPEAALIIDKIIHIETSEISFGFQTVPRNFAAVFLTGPGSGNIEITINAEKYLVKCNEIFFCGAGYDPATISFYGNTATWIVTLLPYTADLLFGEFLINAMRRVDERQIWLENLTATLWSSFPNHHVIAKHIERIFLSRIGSRDMPGTLVGSLREIAKTNGITDVKHLALHACVSERHLRRQFVDWMGISPKRYCTMMRFGCMLSDHIKNQSFSFEETALLYGYYDLAHAHKDALRFLGRSLGESSSWNSELNLQMI